MKFILGTKGKMLTVYTEEGRAFAATVIVAAPNMVTQLKTKEKDGYNAVQMGAVETTDKHVNKAQLGHTKGKALRFFKEAKNRDGSLPQLELGAAVDVSIFAAGEKVTVSAISKGRGFQGVIKRHGFHGGPKTHGQKNRWRAPGSIGSTAPQRVTPGRKMPGHMGDERVTVKNLEVADVDPEKHELLLKGAVPGAPGGILEIVKIKNKK